VNGCSQSAPIIAAATTPVERNSDSPQMSVPHFTAQEFPMKARHKRDRQVSAA
jgi:hypothetical protein